MDKIVLSEHLDVRIVRYNIPLRLSRPRIEVFVDDKPVVHCVHVACTLPKDELRQVESVNELIHRHKSTEHTKVDIDAETLLQLHASNLQAWIENGYDASLIDENIASPILHALEEAGDTRARERYLESILDRWQKGNYTSRKALILYNRGELWELINRNQINEEDLNLIENERKYYLRHGGTPKITAFVFDLQRPFEDHASYISLHSSIYQRIEDHGGFELLHALFDKTQAEGQMPVGTWRDFLRGLQVIEHYRFKRSKYFSPTEPVFVKSDLVVEYKYIVLTMDGWRAVGQIKIPYEEWKEQNRQERLQAKKEVEKETDRSLDQDLPRIDFDFNLYGKKTKGS